MLSVSEIQTMTSLQIAEITGKRHKDVLEAIRNMEPAWEKINGRKFPLVEYKDAKGEMRPMYQLNKTECLYVATKFNDEARAKLVIRWEELEKERMAVGFMVPQTFSEALRLAAEQAERIEEQQKQIAEMSPKAEFFDTVADSKTAISIGELAKILGVKGYGRNNLFEFLRQNDVLDKNNVPMQRYVDAGYFRVIEQHFMRNSEPCVNIKTLVYQRGVDFVRRLIAKRDAVVA